MKDKAALIRIVRKDGCVFIDSTGKANGRGAYICRSSDCIKKAIKQNKFEKALGVRLPEEVCEQLAAFAGENK